MLRLMCVVPLVMLTACHSLIDYKTEAAPIDQEVYATLGTKQCQTTLAEQNAIQMTQLKNQLNQVGIVIKAATLGSDGQMHIQQCGASDGRIAIFRIAASDLDKAQRLGFAVVNSSVRKVP